MSFDLTETDRLLSICTDRIASIQSLTRKGSKSGTEMSPIRA